MLRKINAKYLAVCIALATPVLTLAQTDPTFDPAGPIDSLDNNKGKIIALVTLFVGVSAGLTIWGIARAKTKQASR
jgi:hypothetical protein